MDTVSLTGSPAIWRAVLAEAAGTPPPVILERGSGPRAAAGGLVSTVLDLHTVFTAMFEGQVVSANSLAEMIRNPRSSELAEHYGLGVEVWHRLGGRPVELVGHSGEVAGYQTLAMHAPDTGMTAFWVATNNLVDPSPAFAGVAERIGGTQ